MRSSDSGRTWTPAASPTNLYFFNIIPLAGDSLRLSPDGSLWVSADKGATWQKRDAPGAGAISLVSGEGEFLAAASLDGIFFPSASSTPWLAQGDSLPSKTLTSLLVSEGRLYAGLFDLGLWEMTLPAHPVRIDAPARNSQVNAMSLSRSLGTRILRFALSEPASIRVSIYSVSGKRLASLASRTSGAGMEQVEWNGGAREGGHYLYMAEAYSLMHPGKRLHAQRRVLPP
ncbi:MAG: hypothetical protein ABIW76_20240 [Fibrobacteria bacterium]